MSAIPIRHKVHKVDKAGLKPYDVDKVDKAYDVDKVDKAVFPPSLKGGRGRPKHGRTPYNPCGGEPERLYVYDTSVICWA